MITYHSAETCLETHFYETSVVSRLLGIDSTDPDFSNNTYTATGETEYRAEHGLSYFSSSSKTGNEGGSSQQTFWRPYGARAAQITSATTFKQAWATTSTASLQSASQTSYTSSTIRSRAEQTRLNQFSETVTDVSSIAGTSLENSTTTTYQKNAEGKTLVMSGQYTFSSPATQTYSFTQSFWVLPNSQTLSGSATGTRTTTGSRSLSADGPHTVHFFGPASGLYAQLIFNDRAMLPPTRNVAPAFAVTAPVSASFSPANSISLLSTFEWVKSLYSAAPASLTSSTSFVSGAASVTRRSTSSYDQFSITSASSSLVNFSLSAARRVFSNTTAYAHTNTNSASFFETVNFSPLELSNTLAGPVFVSIFRSNVLSPFIYTSIRPGFLLGGSTASARWIYTNSAWSLHVTKKNSSTSSTLFATIDFSGTAQTTVEDATCVLVESNRPTAILGPVIPLGVSSANRISVTLSGSGDTSLARYHVVSFLQASSSVSSSSTSSSSTTSEHQFGSAALGYAPNTYPDSSLSAYKNTPAVIFSTTLLTGPISYFSASRTILLPTSFRNLKLNEAGQSDPVTVSQ